MCTAGLTCAENLDMHTFISLEVTSAAKMLYLVLVKLINK